MTKEELSEYWDRVWEVAKVTEQLAWMLDNDYKINKLTYQFSLLDDADGGKNLESVIFNSWFQALARYIMAHKITETEIEKAINQISSIKLGEQKVLDSGDVVHSFERDEQKPVLVRNFFHQLKDK